MNGLLIASPDDLLARRALLQILLPGLKRTARGLQRKAFAVDAGQRPWSSRAELEADLIAECLAQIDLTAGRPMAHPASRLLSRVRSWGWRQLYRHADRPGQLTLDLDRYVDVTSPSPATELEDVLADAVAAGTVSGGDAELIWRYRVADEPMVATARAQGVSWALVQKRRERAERRLTAAFAAARLG